MRNRRTAPEEDETEADIAGLARAYGEPAIKMIAAIMNKGGPDAPVRLRAAESLLSHGWGKAYSKRVREAPSWAPVGKIIRVIVDPQRDKQAIKKATRATEEICETKPDC